MNSGARKILSTRPLSAAIKAEAKTAGMQIDELAFIETFPVVDAAMADTLCLMAAEKKVVVFTSMNAVDAVRDVVVKFNPAWQIACLGQTTQSLVAQYLPACSILATGDDAADLAQNMIATLAPQSVVFFCGDQRRDELPQALTAAGFEVQEYLVYKTVEVNASIDNIYDGILFFSPSAVRSFFKTNALPAETILFAVGKTTAAELANFSNNKIVISDAPGKDYLVKKALAMFETSH